MESARINLSYTPIKAPISGRIGRSNITVGAMVTAYQPTPLAVIQQLDPIYVDVTQASADLLRLRTKPGERKPEARGSSQRKVKLLLEDGTPYPQEGTLQFRTSTVDPTTGSVTLRHGVRQSQTCPAPGHVRACGRRGGRERTGPSRSSAGGEPRPEGESYCPGGERRRNKVEQRPIVLDRAIGDKWLVTKGLAPGRPADRRRDCRRFAPAIPSGPSHFTRRKNRCDRRQPTRQPRQSRRGTQWPDSFLIVLFSPGSSPSG